MYRCPPYLRVAHGAPVQCPGVILEVRVGCPHRLHWDRYLGLPSPHSPGGYLYQASHAIPPISLCISVEVLMNIIQSDLTAEDIKYQKGRIQSYIHQHLKVDRMHFPQCFKEKVIKKCINTWSKSENKELMIII